MRSLFVCGLFLFEIASNLVAQEPDKEQINEAKMAFTGMGDDFRAEIRNFGPHKATLSPFAMPNGTAENKLTDISDLPLSFGLAFHKTLEAQVQQLRRTIDG